MPLSDSAIRALKPSDKDYRVADEKGLYIQVSPSGGRLWRMKYRTPGGTEKKLAFGAYPEVSLKAARDLRDDARKLLAAGIDPAEKKKQDRHAAKVSAANSFVVVAQSYIDKCKREGRSERTTDKQQWLLKLLARTIGQRPVAEIQPFEMLEAVRKYETTGRTEAAHRALQFASQVFRFAIANQLAPSDPTRDLRGALTSQSGPSTSRKWSSFTDVQTRARANESIGKMGSSVISGPTPEIETLFSNITSDIYAIFVVPFSTCLT